MSIYGTNSGGGGGGVSSVSGTAPIASSGGATPAISLNDTAVTPGSYTNTSLTVDAKGRLTAASNGTAPVTSVTGTAPIASSGGATPAISLNDTAVTPGSYTNANFTVDAKGRLTAASSSGSTVQVSMLGINTVPDSSGNCWAEPYSILATNDVWPFMIFRFGASNAAAPTTRIGLYGQFTVPQNYVGTLAIIPVWTATITSGDVVWDFDYRTVGGNDTTSLDQAGVEESVTVTDTAPTAANNRLTPSLAPTSANFAAGETVEFGIFRDGADAADTMAGSAMLVDLIFQYSRV